MSQPSPPSDWEAALSALQRNIGAAKEGIARLEAAMQPCRDRIQAELARGSSAMESVWANVRGALGAAAAQLHPIVGAAQRY